jgi:hypothetical protein
MSHEIRVLGELGSEFERVVFAERRRRLARPRWRPLVAIIALSLGGATGALAAAGVFRAGTPVGANVPPTPHVLDGVAVAGSAHLLSLAVSDAQGGPPWGVRIERTTRGLTCLQYGRVDDGTIGALGVDDAFSDDGEFHAFPVNYAQDAGLACATTDAHDNAFVSVTLEAAAASGLEYSCHGVASSLFANLHGADGRNVSKIYQALAERDHGPVCPPSDLRNIYYGLLGPDAVSVTYPSPTGVPISEKTAGAEGAYLVLGPPSGAMCDPGGGCGNGDSGGPGLAPGFITSVTYRNGYVCRIAKLGALQARAVSRYLASLDKRFPILVQARKEGGHLTPQTIAALLAVRRTPAYRTFVAAHRGLFREPTCPLLGYVAPRTPRVTAAEVATPISVRVGQTTREFCGNDPNRRPCGGLVVPVLVAFKARVAVTNINSHYEISMQFAPSGRCPEAAAAGGAASTNADIRAGQIVRHSETVSACPGTYHGNVVYAANTGPSNNSTVPGLPGQGAGVLVGTFTFHMP